MFSCTRNHNVHCVIKNYISLSSESFIDSWKEINTFASWHSKLVTPYILKKILLGPFTLAKTKIQKTWVFCCTVYTARKTHNIRGFWHEKRMRKKARISYWCFGKWCACATSLYLWPYTCSAHYFAGRGRVIPLKVTYRVTKNPNNTLRDWSRRLHWQKKPWKTRGVSKNPTPEVGFFIQVFLAVFRGSCLATSHEKPECTKDSGFFMKV